MIEQAKPFITLGEAITVKLPCTVEGLKACEKALYHLGVKTNVTLVFSPAQAILAAKARATYISPFVGRVEDNSFDGLDTIKRIRKVYDNTWEPETDYDTPYILGASIRDVRQVERCAEFGADVDYYSTTGVLENV